MKTLALAYFVILAVILVSALWFYNPKKSSSDHGRRDVW